MLNKLYTVTEQIHENSISCAEFLEDFSTDQESAVGTKYLNGSFLLQIYSDGVIMNQQLKQQNLIIQAQSFIKYLAPNLQMERETKTNYLHSTQRQPQI